MDTSYTVDGFSYPRFTVPNKHIAVEPFPSQSLEKEIKGGVLVLKQKGSLQQLRVIFGNEDYAIGQAVYLRSERYTATWAKEVFEVEGVRFIVIPETEVLLVNRFPAGLP